MKVWAFSGQGGIRDTLEDAYVAVFGEKEPQEAAAPAQTAAQIFSGVYGPENLPEGVKLEQQVLGFAYGAPLQGTVTSGFVLSFKSLFRYNSFPDSPQSRLSLRHKNIQHLKEVRSTLLPKYYFPISHVRQFSDT